MKQPKRTRSRERWARSEHRREPAQPRNSPTAVTPKQALFLREYQLDYNATRAARRAGYSAKTAKEQGSRLLSNVNVQAALADAQAALRNASELTIERLDQETSILATSDLRRMMSAGEWVPLQDIPDDLAPAVAGIEVLFKPGEDDEPPQKLMKIRLWDKPSALKLLYQRRGALTDTRNVNVKGSLVVSPQEFEAEVRGWSDDDLREWVELAERHAAERDALRQKFGAGGRP